MEEKKITTNVKVYRFDELSAENQELINEAKKQVEKSYAPYSNFRVGAALRLENGNIITGNNQENSAYPSGLCAERVAMFYANAQYPDVPIKALAIAAFTKGEYVENPITPCGACRQALLESETRFENNVTVLLYGTKHVYMIENIKQLLPLSFGKSSLL